MAGRLEWVLDTAQLLRDKLLRSDVLSSSAAFDLAVAAVADPRALELAVNALSARSARVAEHNLHLVDTSLVSLPFANRLDPAVVAGLGAQLVGAAAARAVRAARYAAVAIRLRSGVIEVATRAAGGALRVERHGSRDVPAALCCTGMRAYLAANTVVLPGALQREVEALAARGRSAVVFSAGDAGLLPSWVAS